MIDEIRGRIRESVDVHETLLRDPTFLASVEAAVELVTTTFRGGAKLLIFGNGGSASDASHIAAEFAFRVFIERPGLPAVALGPNFSVSSAIANDYAYRDVFSKQLEGLGRPGDAAWGITTSGNSENVIEGLRVARSRGLATLALTGRTGGRLPKVDVLIRVPSDATPRIQEGHILVGHIVSELVEARLFGRGG